MWFIGVEVEQETSAPPPKKILDPSLNRVKKEDVCTVFPPRGIYMPLNISPLTGLI